MGNLGSTSIENSRRLAAEYSSRDVSVTSFPAVMYVESTLGCPYRCIMCSVPEKYGRKSIDIDKYLLERVSPYFKYLKLLGIHGNGEPLLSRNIDYFIESSRDNGCFLHMNTTGFYLRPALSDRLLSTKLHMQFSIHAGTKETYKKIMGNDLDRVIKNISYLTEKNARLGYTDNEFWFSYIVVKETVDEIDDFLRLASGAGINKVRFMKLGPNIKNLKGAKINRQDFRYKYFEQSNTNVQESFLAKLPHIRGLGKELGLSVQVGSMEFSARNHTNLHDVLHKAQDRLVPGISVFPLKRRRGNCLAPWTGQVQIGQDGNINLCCGTKYSIGNLYDKDFAEIWNDYQIRAIRGAFNKGFFHRACGPCKGMPADEYGIDLIEAVSSPMKQLDIA